MLQKEKKKGKIVCYNFQQLNMISCIILFCLTNGLTFQYNQFTIMYSKEKKINK